MCNDFRFESFYNGRPLTIWELRNSYIYTRAAEILCDFGFNPEVRTRVQAICPLDPYNLNCLYVMQKWGEEVKEKSEGMRAALLLSNQHEKVDLLNSLLTTFVFDGYMDYYKQLLPPVDETTFPIAFCHNDALELNWLMNLQDSSELILIDYEYGGWNPMAMDVANYLNETMLDNAHPGDNGLACYEMNVLTVDEVSSMARAYLSRYYHKYMPQLHKDQLYPTEASYLSVAES